MDKTEKLMDSMNLIQIAAKALDDKKAERLKIIDISKISIMADYMMIASGSNKNQIQAMADNVIEQLHKAGCRYRAVEGYDAANWVLIDAHDLIIHIFDRESRDFYDIERLYQDGVYIDV